MGALYGIRINQRCPYISHLMFADDTILFLRVSDSYIRTLLSQFDQYRSMSGQRVNLAKSAVLFSNNTPTPIQLRYKDALGVRFLDRSEKYLRLPCIILRSKEETFRFIEDKMALRLRSWKMECLSPAGIHTLLQSVIAGLPVYAMSCYELTDNMCKALNTLMAKFWWVMSCKTVIKYYQAKKLSRSYSTGFLLVDYSKKLAIYSGLHTLRVV
ncbi:hypothetical protein LINPERHAP1_LOCUS9434 [Linum perenne]